MLHQWLGAGLAPSSLGTLSLTSRGAPDSN